MYNVRGMRLYFHQLTSTIHVFGLQADFRPCIFVLSPTIRHILIRNLCVYRSDQMDK